MDKCCEGCKKSAPGTNMECHVYGIVPSPYARAGECPVNPHIVEVKKVKVNPLKASKKAKKGR